MARLNSMTQPRRRSRRVLLAVTVAICLLAVAGPLALVAARSSVVAASTRLIGLESTGGVVRIQDRDVDRRPFGVKDPTTGQPTQGNERFRIGSATKTFVATVVMQLVDEDRIVLDDPVETYLPGSVPSGKQLTVRQVLNHTSGLYDYMKGEGLSTNRWRGDDRFKNYRPEELLKLAITHPPNFAPGTDFRYSNTNYIVAGLIIERVTGKTYGYEIEQRILTPLGLRDTSMPGDDPSITGSALRARSQATTGSTVDVTEQNVSLDWAAGEMISTPDDLARFFDALLEGRLTTAESLRQMRTTVPMGMGFHYGLGLERFDLPCGGQLWGHGGKLLGYLTYAYRRDDGRSLLVAAASTEGDAFTGFAAVATATYCLA